MKTLIATDGSQEATTALSCASRLLRRRNNEVSVLCVAPKLDAPGRRVVDKKKAERALDRYNRSIARETASIIKNAESLLAAEGIETQSISQIGSPADVIVDVSGDYDITVVGASGRRHASVAGLGSVASRVLEHSSRSVLLARELTNSDTLRVLVAVDGSIASKRALNALTTFFEIDSAEITLIHVKETPWIHIGLDREWFEYPRSVFDQSDPEIQLEDELQREAESVLEAAQERLAKYNYSVLTLIQDGNPATEILGEAESGQYDLIVLGAAGASDTKHNMLGSVSVRVAWQAPCSVAIVKVVE